MSVRIPRAPETLTCCNCSICRRYGTLWAYYQRGEVEIAGFTSGYSWGPRTLEFVRCSSCGCITHWQPLVPERGPRIGVNARNFDPAQLGAVRIRWLDGAVTEKYLE